MTQEMKSRMNSKVKVFMIDCDTDLWEDLGIGYFELDYNN